MTRPMQRPDIDQVVKIHLASFPGFFLSFLGARFLALFYAGICRAEHGIAYVYLDGNGQPAGFVAGTSDPPGFYRGLLRRDWLRFGLAALPAVARRPAVIGRLLRAMSQPSASPAGGDVAGLLSIGVDPALQGRGAGKALVRAFLDEARSRGVRRVYLTTDRRDNGPANAFYQHLGFAVGREYATPEGRQMNEYWIELK